MLDFEQEVVRFRRRVTGRAKLEISAVLFERENSVRLKEEEGFINWIKHFES